MTLLTPRHSLLHPLHRRLSSMGRARSPEATLATALESSMSSTSPFWSLLVQSLAGTLPHSSQCSRLVKLVVTLFRHWRGGGWLAPRGFIMSSSIRKSWQTSSSMLQGDIIVSMCLQEPEGVLGQGWAGYRREWNCREPLIREYEKDQQQSSICLRNLSS